MIALLRLSVLLSCASVLAADEPARWTQFLGRFHMVTLHLPIGMFVALAIVEMRTWYKRQLAPDGVRTPLVLVTAASSVISVIFGLLLGQSGDYDPDQLSLHQWLGIATAGLSGILVALDHRQRTVPGVRLGYHLTLAISLVAVTITGHLGGSLTHGRGFLTRYAPWTDSAAAPATLAPASPAPSPAPASAEPMADEPIADEPMAPSEAPPVSAPTPIVAPAPTPTPATTGSISFSRQIEPILGERCYSCHGADKQKGGLRLDSPAAIRSGGKNGVVLMAGQPDKSKLYTLLVLPEDHDDFMPAKGGPLKPEQISLIKRWIASGAAFDEAAPSAIPAPATSAPARTSAAQTTTGYDQLSSTLATPDQRAVTALTAAGAVVRALSTDGKALEVNCSHLTAKLDDRLLQHLGKLGNNVLWLDVSGSSITGAQLTVLRLLPNLQRLHLEHTTIDDAALVQLLPLSKLEYLNLVATQVSDAGLYRLKNLAALRRLYLWQSKATKAGAARLAADMANCSVSSGP